MRAMNKLGARVTFVGPCTLMPSEANRLGVLFPVNQAAAERNG